MQSPFKKKFSTYLSRGVLTIREKLKLCHFNGVWVNVCWKRDGEGVFVSFGFKECFNQFDWRAEPRQEGKLDLQPCRERRRFLGARGRGSIYIYIETGACGGPGFWDSMCIEREREGVRGCHNHRDASNHPLLSSSKLTFRLVCCTRGNSSS